MSTKCSRKTVNKAQINRAKHKKKNHRRSGTNPFVIFLGTLGIVLSLGALFVVCISLPKYLKMHQYDQVSFADFVETIPQTLVMKVEEPEVLGANAAQTKYGDVIRDEAYLEENNIFLKEGATKDSVTLGFVGDILFDDEYAVMCALKQRGGELSSGISQDTLDRMNAVDIMVVNNEFPYTERGSRQTNKQYTFHADYDTAFYLNDMGADVAILANNHVYDFGEEGLLDSLDTLNNVGVHPVGAGRNLKEAVTPVYYIVNDIKIAIVAASQIERESNPNTKAATETSPGVFRCWQNDLIYTAVEVAKQNADFVIACIHWGTEKDPNPDTWQLEMAPKLAEAGADLIIGDHTHRLQGVYYYGDTPCIYSLGNFWFNGYALDTGMVEVTINKDGLDKFQFLPAIQSNFSTKLVYDSEKTRIIDYLRSLSKGAVIDAEGYITKAG